MSRALLAPLCVVLGALAVTASGATPAWAGSLRVEPSAPVIQRDGTRVRSRPRKNAATVIVLEAGRPVQIVQRTKRWLKVKVGRKVGWVETAAVGAPLATPAAAPAEAPAEAPAKASAKASAKAPAEPDGHGRDGWGHAQMGSTPDDATAAGPAPAADTETATETLVAQAVRPRPRAGLGLELGIGAGVAARRSTFSSDGTSPFANHRYDEDALAFEGEARLLRGRRFVIGFDTRVAHHRSAPGVNFTAPDGQSQDIALSDWRFDAVVVVGLRATRGTLITGRAGYEYEFLDVADLMNLATVGREARRGPLLGLGATLTDHGGTTVHAEVDLLVGGALEQTHGREDGTPGTVFAARAGAGVAFALGGGLALRLDYRLSEAYASFAGPSLRHANLTHGERWEREHELLVAMGWSL